MTTPASSPLFYPKDESTTTRVMSVQGDAVSSNIGIKAASSIFTFMKIDLTGIPVALYSTHTGFGSCYGVLKPEGTVENIYEAFSYNGLASFHYVLTGYLFTPSILEETGKVVGAMKRGDPRLIYLCDPVLGNCDPFYVDRGFEDIYLERLIPLADIVTPNQFQLEKLTKMTVNSLETAFKAMETLNGLGPRVVILTSIPSSTEGRLCSLLSCSFGRETLRYFVEFPEINVNFHGCGDTLSAMVISWLDRLNGDIIESFERSINSIQQILKSTYTYAEGLEFSLENLNLRIVESCEAITSPPIFFKVKEFVSR